MSEPAPVFETWGGGQSPVAIEYSLVVLEEIRNQVTQGFRRLSRGGIEVGGVLYGTRDGRRIRIEAVRPIACEHSRGPSFLLSEQDRAQLEQQLAEAASDPRLAPLECLGWFVSHTRGDLALTSADQETFQAYFPNPWQVTLVVRPGRGNNLRAAFFVREPDGTVRADQSYQEFDFPERPAGVFDAPQRATRLAERGERTPPRAAAAVANSPVPRPEPARPLPQAGASLPYSYPPATPPRRNWPWLVGSLAILAVLAFLGLRYLWQPRVAEGLGLLMTERDGELQIEWNNATRSIMRATRGLLLILDGPLTERVPLTRSMLAEGHYSYLRKGADVEVRMEVETPDGVLRESSRFLGRPPVNEADRRSVELEAEKAALERQVEQLKEENATLRERIQQLERTQRLLESRLGILNQ
jgi:proteasome lid subunit RPN8/RPN11